MTLRNITETVSFRSDATEQNIHDELMERGRSIIDMFASEHTKEKLYWSNVTYTKLPKHDLALDSETWELTASSLYAYEDYAHCNIGDLFYSNFDIYQRMFSQGQELNLLVPPEIKLRSVHESAPMESKSKLMIFKPATIVYQSYGEHPTYIPNFWTLKEIRK